MAAKKRAAKRLASKRNASSRKSPAPKGIRISLKQSTLEEPTLPSFDDHGQPSQIPAAKVHHYSAMAFLFSAIIGFALALRFAADGNWLVFLVSLALFIISSDKLLFSLHKKQEALGSQPSHGLHHLSAHVFLLFALIGFVFAITFWLKGQLIMLLLSGVVLILGLDNMLVARQNHHDSS